MRRLQCDLCEKIEVDDSRRAEESVKSEGPTLRFLSRFGTWDQYDVCTECIKTVEAALEPLLRLRNLRINKRIEEEHEARMQRWTQHAKERETTCDSTNL